MGGPKPIGKSLHFDSLFEGFPKCALPFLVFHICWPTNQLITRLQAFGSVWAVEGRPGYLYGFLKT